MRAVRPALEKGLKATLTVVRYFVIMVGSLVCWWLAVDCSGEGELVCLLFYFSL